MIDPFGIGNGESICLERLREIASLRSNYSVAVLAEFVTFCVVEQADNNPINSTPKETAEIIFFIMNFHSQVTQIQ